jgi:ATP synthase in type III secretion protein N
VMSHVAGESHVSDAARVRELLSKYQDIELLVQIGEYREGADPLADAALRAKAPLEAFFSQRADALAPFNETLATLHDIARRH